MSDPRLRTDGFPSAKQLHINSPFRFTLPLDLWVYISRDAASVLLSPPFAY